MDEQNEVKVGYLGMCNLDDCWDAAVIDFCRTRYPLALEPILVRTSTMELNVIYAIIVPPYELSDDTLTAIYEQGVVKCYTVGKEYAYGNARLTWRNPNTGEYFIPKEEIRA